MRQFWSFIYYFILDSKSHWKRLSVDFSLLPICSNGVQSTGLFFIPWDCKLSGLKSLRIVHDQRSAKNLNFLLFCLWICCSHYFKIINDFCGQSPFECYKVSLFWTQKDCPFSLNRDVSSIEVTNTKIMRTFSGTEYYVLYTNVSQMRSSTVMKEKL